MSNEQTPGDIEQVDDDQVETEKNPATEGEFKVLVRKLELPVRPRGVLAE